MSGKQAILKQARYMSRLGRRLGLVHRQMVARGDLPDDWAERTWLQMVATEQRHGEQIDHTDDIHADLARDGMLHYLEPEQVTGLVQMRGRERAGKPRPDPREKIAAWQRRGNDEQQD